MNLLVQTCHRRGALATGGMTALLLPEDPGSNSHRDVLAAVTRWERHSLTLFLSFTFISPYFRLKLLEIKAGVDGFMVYDLKLIEPMQEVSTPSQSVYVHGYSRLSSCLICSSSFSSTLMVITSFMFFGRMWTSPQTICCACLRSVTSSPPFNVKHHKTPPREQLEAYNLYLDK